MLLDTHYPGMVSKAVEQLEHDLNWYKGQYEEAVKIIAQLHRGYAPPGEPTYIHPADFAELIDQIHRFDVISIYRTAEPLPDTFFLPSTGQRFKQSALMPQISKTV